MDGTEGRRREKIGWLVRELSYYLSHRKRLWLVPLIAALLAFWLLVFLTETVPIVSPFIYTLF